MRKFIIGNWKMHGAAAEAHTLVEAVAEAAAKAPQAEVIVCPPTTLLAQVTSWLVGSNVKTGGQDCHAEAEGAHTGSISAAMLEEAGAAYVIVGHSERRAAFGETNDEVKKKAQAAMGVGLIPIICVGETAAERDAGKAEEVVARQVSESLPKGHFLLAYEPVWAIGTGKTPTARDIESMHAHIIAVAARETGLARERIFVVYGGSVNAANARQILATKGVSGVLVGGASLKAEAFCNIINSSE
ncbi:MAG: triose-phosphate isomerase [Pseudomonadota bacterium]|nr:triose-phosphate isomerase [Pseudomonadota bacterium]